MRTNTKNRLAAAAALLIGVTIGAVPGFFYSPTFEQKTRTPMAFSCFLDN